MTTENIIPQPPGAAYAEDLSADLIELAHLISGRVSSWHDFGYANPPTPECNPIPPLGERSAGAIQAGHLAVEAIDEMIGKLHALRGQLVSEMRQDADIRAVRADALLAACRTGARS